MLRRESGSGIGTDSHFHYLLNSDVKCTAEKLGTGCLQARTLLSRLKMIGGGGRGLLKVFNVVLFQFLGPNWARRYLGRGLRSKYEDCCMMCCGAWA